MERAVIVEGARTPIGKFLGSFAETPAVETAQQPYVLMRSLRSVQDQVAQGSAAAHQFQKNFMRDLGIQLIDAG